MRQHPRRTSNTSSKTMSSDKSSKGPRDPATETYWRLVAIGLDPDQSTPDLYGLIYEGETDVPLMVDGRIVFFTDPTRALELIQQHGATLVADKIDVAKPFFVAAVDVLVRACGRRGHRAASSTIVARSERSGCQASIAIARAWARRPAAADSADLEPRGCRTRTRRRRRGGPPAPASGRSIRRGRAEDEFDELERQRAERRARILGEHDSLTAREAAEAAMGAVVVAPHSSANSRVTQSGSCPPAAGG